MLNLKWNRNCFSISFVENNFWGKSTEFIANSLRQSAVYWGPAQFEVKFVEILAAFVAQQRPRQSLPPQKRKKSPKKVFNDLWKVGLRHWRSIWLLESFKWFSVFFLPVVWPGRRENNYELIENCSIVGGRRTFCLQIQGRGLWREGLSKWVGAIREDQSHWCNMR